MSQFGISGARNQQQSRDIGAMQNVFHGAAECKPACVRAAYATHDDHAVRETRELLENSLGGV